MKVIEALEKLIQTAIDDGAFPGANYCIVSKNHSFFGSLGSRTLFPESEKNNIDTIYDMASLSKVISTTSLIWKLVENGLLRLHTTVQTFIPKFRHQEVTVWDLLTHSSGLPADVSRARKSKAKRIDGKKYLAMDLVYPVIPNCLFGYWLHFVGQSHRKNYRCLFRSICQGSLIFAAGNV